MEEYNFLLETPKLNTMTKAELYELINKYKYYIRENYELNLSNKNQNQDANIIIKKLKISLETSNTFIEHLKQKNAKLQLDLKILSEQLNYQIKELKDELYNLKHTDNLQKFKNALTHYKDNTENIKITNVDKIIDENCIILSKLQPNKFTDSFIDIRLKILPRQINNEKIIIDNLKTLLNEYFENIIDSLNKKQREIVKLDIDSILIKITESKHRLSLIMKESVYRDFLLELIKDINNILDLFNMNTIGEYPLNFELSAYDKWILNYPDYIFYYDNHSDNLQRLILNNIPGNTLQQFTIFSELDKYCIVTPLYSLIENLIVTSTNINNISYVPTENKECFFVLENMTNDFKFWKKDTFLINLIRNISKKLTYILKLEFKKFYKDSLGHNNYINNFEKILIDKGVKRWKQYKILYDNIRTISDEYMFGEIIREIIRSKCSYIPTNNDKIKNDNQDKIIIKDFQNAKIYFSKGKPYIDEHEYFIDLFDDLSQFDDEKHIQEYNERWEQFLINYYK